MALYLGSSNKQKIILNDIMYHLNLLLEYPIVNNVVLLSSDNYILKDSNGLYLLPKDSFVVNSQPLLSSEGYILKDKNDLYLMIEGVE